jgi:hypothetical protein
LLPYVDGPLHDCLIDPAGVTADDNNDLMLMLCPHSHSALKNKK